MRNVVADHEAKEAIIRASKLGWVIVRPPRLTNGARRGDTERAWKFEQRRPFFGTSADLAAFMLASSSRTHTCGERQPSCTDSLDGAARGMSSTRIYAARPRHARHSFARHSCERSGRRMSFAMFLMVAIAAPALSACSSKDDRREFQAQAERICGRANAMVRALGPEPPILTPRHATWIESLTDIDLQAVRELRRLETGERDRSTVESMLRAFDRGLAYGDEVARASGVGDDRPFRRAVFAAIGWFDKARARAIESGLAECSQLGSVDRARS
jgi:NAD(P)H-binding